MNAVTGTLISYAFYSAIVIRHSPSLEYTFDYFVEQPTKNLMLKEFISNVLAWNSNLIEEYFLTGIFGSYPSLQTLAIELFCSYNPAMALQLIHKYFPSKDDSYEQIRLMTAIFQNCDLHNPEHGVVISEIIESLHRRLAEDPTYEEGLRQIISELASLDRSAAFEIAQKIQGRGRAYTCLEIFCKNKLPFADLYRVGTLEPLMQLIQRNIRTFANSSCCQFLIKKKQ